MAAVLRKERSAPLYRLCVGREALMKISKEEFDSRITNVLLPAGINSVAYVAGNSGIVMESDIASTPLTPTVKALRQQLVTGEVRIPILERVNYVFSFRSLSDYTLIVHQIIEYPPSNSSIETGLANISKVMSGEGLGDLRWVLDNNVAAIKAFMNHMPSLGLSKMLLVMGYISTGATGLSATPRLVEYVRSRLPSTGTMNVIGVDFLQVSPPGTSATREEAIKRYEIVRDHILQLRFKNKTEIPLIIIPFILGAGGDPRYPTNDDILKILMLFEAVASAKMARIAGTLTDFTKPRIYIPTRTISGSVIMREGAKVLKEHILHGDLVELGDDIIDWRHPTFIAYASNEFVARGVFDEITRSRLATELSTNNIVIRYDELPQHEYFVMALYPVKPTRYQEFLKRVERIITEASL